MSVAAAASGAAPAASPALSQAHPTHPLLQEGQQRRAECMVGGQPTSLIVTSFADRIFVAVTQSNKIGTITMASTQRSPASLSDAPSYSVTTVLGVRNAPLPHLLARRLIESLSRSAHAHMAAKPLLLSLALKHTRPAVTRAQGADDAMPPTLDEQDLQMIREIVEEVEKIKQW